MNQAQRQEPEGARAPANHGQRRGRRLGTLVAGLAVLAALALAGAAYAYVELYRADFSGQRQAQELRKHEGGNACRGAWRREDRALRVGVTRGPHTCAFRLPITGDRPRPDHDVRARARINRITPQQRRRSAYASVMLRAGGGDHCATGRTTGYELRVFPGPRRYQVLRRPVGVDSEFPVTGRSRNHINGLPHPNVLRLQVVGSRVVAFVNGNRVETVEDDTPGPVRGCAVTIGAGQTQRSNRPTVFDYSVVSAGLPGL